MLFYIPKSRQIVCGLAVMVKGYGDVENGWLKPKLSRGVVSPQDGQNCNTLSSSAVNGATVGPYRKIHACYKVYVVPKT